jgi:hypothetical protein
MAYRRIERLNWESYIRGLAHRLPAGRAHVRVGGLDIGDQVEVDQLAMTGIGFDPRDGCLDLTFDGLDHRICDIGEIWADEREGELHALCVTHPDGRLEVIDFTPAKAITARGPSGEARP